jgi:hypothetical protein
MRSIFNTLQTITGRKIRIRPNFSARTFTIKTDAANYRTYKMSKNEFNSSLFNTGNDWNQFLKSDDYYRI